MTPPPGTVFFLSDYGLRDTFVGIVHAVLRSQAPDAPVIDLTHEIAPFDVRGGARALSHAVPHLGPGVVLAVVDPGVGGGRRCVVVAVGPLWMVGPDNGLLVPAIDELGGTADACAWALPAPPAERDAHTFDGRDVMAPAVAALCRGEDPGSFADAIDPASLVRVADPVVEHGARDAEGRFMVRAEVTGLDRFGNAQLAARRADLPPSMPRPGDEDVRVAVTLTPAVAHPERDLRTRHDARWVTTFADLDPGELGLLVDSDGSLALVMPEASAAASRCIAEGDLVELAL